jgi:hypothetical protein
LLFQLSNLLVAALLAGALDLPGQPGIVWVVSTTLPARVLRYQYLLHECIQFMQVYVGQTGTETPTLRRSAVGAVVLPILDIPCFEAHSDEVEQPTVVDVSG